MNMRKGKATQNEMNNLGKNTSMSHLDVIKEEADDINQTYSKRNNLQQLIRVSPNDNGIDDSSRIGML